MMTPLTKVRLVCIDRLFGVMLPNAASEKWTGSDGSRYEDRSLADHEYVIGLLGPMIQRG